MNNDNDLNLRNMTKLSGWLRYWLSFSTLSSFKASVTSQYEFFMGKFKVSKNLYKIFEETD